MSISQVFFAFFFNNLYGKYKKNISSNNILVTRNKEEMKMAKNDYNEKNNSQNSTQNNSQNGYQDNKQKNANNDNNSKNSTKNESNCK